MFKKNGKLQQLLYKGGTNLIVMKISLIPNVIINNCSILIKIRPRELNIIIEIIFMSNLI